MGTNSSISEKDAVFSFCQTQTAVEVIWKVQTTVLTGQLRKYRSPEFKFQNVTWALKMYPYGISKTKAPYIGLYLEQVPLLFSNFKWKCSVVGASKKMFHSRVCTIGSSEYGRDFSEHDNSWGWSEFLDREQLLEGKLGKILSDDTLTIYCGIEVDEHQLLTGFNILSEYITNGCDCALAKDLQMALEKGLNFDVILKIENKRIPAHKVVLSARSKVFEAMFKDNLNANLDHVVNLADMEESVAKEMLLYIYTGKVTFVSAENAVDLYTVADRYMLYELKDKCRTLIAQNLSVDNITAIAAKLHLHNDEEFTDSIKSFLAENIKEVIKSDGWLTLSKQNSQFYLDLLNTAVSK